MRRDVLQKDKMTKRQRGNLKLTPFLIPLSTLALAMLLWVSLWMNGGVSDSRVRVLLLVTPIAAVGTLLQALGLFMNDVVLPEHRARLVLLDLAVLVVVGCLLVAGTYLFPEAFDWIRSCKLRN